MLTLSLLAGLLLQNQVENQDLVVSQIVVDSSASSRVMVTAMSANAQRFAKGGSQGEVSVSTVSSGGSVYQAVLSANTAQWAGTAYESWVGGMGERVTGLAFDPAGARLYVALGDGTVRRIALGSGTVEFTQAMAFPVSSIGLNAAGTRLAVGDCLGKIEEFDVSGAGAPQYVRTYRPEDSAGAVRSLRYIDSDQKLFSALTGYHLSDDAENGTTSPGPFLNAGPTVWSTSTGGRLIRFGGPEGSVDMAYSGGNYIFGNTDWKSAVYSGAGSLLVDDPFSSGGRVGVLTSSGGGAKLVASLRGGSLTLAEAQGGYESLMRFQPESRFSVGSLAVCDGTEYFSVGLSSGEAAVFSVQSVAPAIRSNLISQALGQVGPYSISATQELLGHMARVDEVCVSVNGDYVATRDSKGVGCLWGRGPGGQFYGYALSADFSDCWGTQNVFAFDAAETTLYSVDTTGVIQVTDLSTAGYPTTPLTVMTAGSPGSPVSVVSVMPAPSGEIVVGARDGALHRVDSQGVIIQTLVAALPSTDLLTPPFTQFLPGPGGNRFLAAPTSVSRHAPASHRATAFSFSSWQDLGDLVGWYAAAQFACVGPSSFVVADGGESNGVTFLNSNSLAVLASGDIAARDGIGCFAPDYALGFDGKSMVAVWRTGSSVQSQTIALSWGAGVSSVGSPHGGGIVVAGLKTGRVVVVEAN